MKKLYKIEAVEFKNDLVLLNEVSISVNDNIVDWLNKHSNLNYTIDKYMEKYPECERVSFNEYPGINIFTENEIVNSVSVYPFIPNDSRYYNGDVIVFGEKIAKPFLSVDIEKYFTGVKIAQPSRGYWERFKAHESVIYNINDNVEIDIMMNRDPKYVGGISLRIKLY